MPAQNKLKKSPNINLLPEDEFEKTPFGKFIKWALSTGRYIVVFTELIVILAFLSRFKFDRDLTDIHESIEQKKAIVTSAEDLEKQIRYLKDYLGKTNEMVNKQRPYSSFLAAFSQLVPDEITIDNFSLKENVLSLAGVSQTAKGIGSFVYQLKNSPKFSSVSVESISKRLDSEVKFKISVVLSKDAFKD